MSSYRCGTLEASTLAGQDVACKVEAVMTIGRVMAAVSFAAVVPVVLSQQPQNQGGEVTTLRQTKQTVIVDVVVGDRYGTAVAGLKQEDFTVLQDGKPQPITFFEVHGGAPMRTGTLPKLPRECTRTFRCQRRAMRSMWFCWTR